MNKTHEFRMVVIQDEVNGAEVDVHINGDMLPLAASLAGLMIRDPRVLQLITKAGKLAAEEKVKTYDEKPEITKYHEKPKN